MEIDEKVYKEVTMFGFKKKPAKKDLLAAVVQPSRDIINTVN